ncbi:MAG TPA: 5-formyltetrahydrofolate cyclo-ligase [Stellaceae bacterium]|nr:5-formyltetrahydrofolate cyclo-ligase [Stellaceae bacterium]
MNDAAVKVWRREQRARLIALRLALDPALRKRHAAAIEAALLQVIGSITGEVLGICWPFKAEFDARPLAERLRGSGWLIALPAVVDKRGALEYRLWEPGMAMASGVYDIPVPEARNVVRPDVVLAPLVGFDAENYRLGYGGGYFDRTLAALAPRPLAVGVGFEVQRLDSVYPRPHDIAMDVIVTEAQCRRRNANP